MQHILFPVDFSGPCSQTAPAVAALAKRFAAMVSLLHVVRLPSLRSEFAPLKHHFQTALEELEGGLRDYQRELWAGLRADYTLRTGDPAREIVAFAHQQAADLIMMPTRGETPFRQLLLGSVTASVLHDAECAVWTTAHAEAVAPYQPYRSIVCAVDLGESTMAVLRAAALMTRQYSATLHVVHSTAAESADEALVRYAVLAAEAELPKEAAFELLENHDVTEAVLAAAGRHGADLLLIGRGRLQGTLGRLRTRAHQLIRRSPCPVISA